MRKLWIGLICVGALAAIYGSYIYQNLRWHPAGRISELLPKGRNYAFKAVVNEPYTKLGELNAALGNLDQAFLGMATEGEGTLYGGFALKAAGGDMPKLRNDEDNGIIVEQSGISHPCPGVKMGWTLIRMLPFVDLKTTKSQEPYHFYIGHYRGIVLFGSSKTAIQEMISLYDRLPARKTPSAAVQVEFRPKICMEKILGTVAKKFQAPNALPPTAYLSLMQVEAIEAVIEQWDPVQARLTMPLPSRTGIFAALPVDGDLEYPAGFPARPDSFCQINIPTELTGLKTASPLTMFFPPGFADCVGIVNALDGLATGRISRYGLGDNWVWALDLVQDASPQMLQRIKAIRDNKPSGSVSWANHQDRPVLVERQGSRYQLIGYQGKQLFLANELQLFKSAQENADPVGFFDALGFLPPPAAHLLAYTKTKGKKAIVLLQQKDQSLVLQINEVP